MPATKAARTLLASQSLAPGATVHAATLDLSGDYGAVIYVRITNGASAPTTAPLVRFFSGDAAAKKYLRYTASGDTVNSSVTDLECEYGPAHMFANVTIVNGNTNAITVEVFGQELTGI